MTVFGKKGVVTPRGALLLVIFLAWGGLCAGADIQWDPSTMSYTIPADSNHYYVDSSITLTMDLVINGTFEARGGADLTMTDSTINIDVEPGGVLRVIGEDGGDDDGSGGSNGSSAILTSDGTITVKADGTLNVIGGNGGDGEDVAGSQSTFGGTGGRATLIGGGTVVTKTGSYVLIGGGKGGNGGDSGGAAYGTDGGNGGEAKITDGSDLTVVIETPDAFDIIGGDGGNGGDDYLPSIYSAGDGGYGGNATLDNKKVIFKAASAKINVKGGNGGNDGVGDGTLNGDGGQGGDASALPHKVELDSGIAGAITITMMISDGLDASTASGGGAQGFTNDTELKATTKKFPSDDIFDCTDLDLTLSQDLYVNFTWTISCPKNIWGNGRKIILGPNGHIVIDGEVAVKFDDLGLEGLNDHRLRCITGDEDVTWSNVDVKQDGNYSFTKGELWISGDCTIFAPNLFFSLVDLVGELTILENSTLKLLKDATLEYDCNPEGLFVMTDDTSTLFLQDARILATQPLTLMTGNMVTEGLSILQGVGTLDVRFLDDLHVRGGLAKVGDVVWT